MHRAASQNAPLPLSPSDEERLRRSEQVRLRLLRYSRVFRRFWWLVAIAVGIGLAFQGWQALTRPVSYASYARILVSGKIALPEGGVFNEEALNFFGTQIELMKSQEVQRRAAARVQAQRPDLSPSGVSLSVSQIPRTSIFVLRASGNQPDYVKAYLNSVLEEYIALRRGIIDEKSDSALSAITAELARVERELRRSEDEIITWKSENNLVFLKEGSDAAGAQLSSLNNRLATLEAEHSLMDRLTDEQNLGRAVGISTGATEASEVDGDFLLSSDIAGAAQSYFTAQQKLFLLEREREQLAEVRTDLHPKVQQIDEEIRSTTRLLDLYRQQAREKLASRKQSLGAQIANTKEQIEKWEERATSLGRKTGEFERLSEKVEREKALYERLLGSIQRVDVNSNIQQDILSVMEYATPPSISIQPLARDLLVGGLAGLAAGFGILLLIAAFDDRVTSANEVQALLGQEVIGILPQVPDGQELLRLSEDDNQGLLEAVRKVRSWLLFSNWENGPPKSIMVTSAMPNDGKSTCAHNLAICLASMQKKVLLIDADLRRGNLHRMMQVEQDPGLGNLLNGECSPDKAIVDTGIPFLSMIPRGFYEMKGSEVFLGTSLEHLLAEVEEKYDFVVFDSSPALATDESSILASRIDVVLLVVRSSLTSLRLAKRTTNHLIDRGAAVEGILYNGVSPTSHEYPYYHYYYSDDNEPNKSASKSPV